MEGMMKITDDMVEEGWRGLDEFRRLYVSKAEVGQILAAALSASPAGVGVETPPPSTQLETRLKYAYEAKHRCNEDANHERQRAIAAEARAEAAESQISEIANHLDSECDSDSILHIIREAQADRDIYKERAEAAEALLKEAKTALEPFARYRTADGVTGMDGRTHLRVDDNHMLLWNMVGMENFASVDPNTIVTTGHFRAARAIHHKIGVKDE